MCLDEIASDGSEDKLLRVEVRVVRRPSACEDCSPAGRVSMFVSCGSRMKNAPSFRDCESLHLLATRPGVPILSEPGRLVHRQLLRFGFQTVQF